MPEATCAEARCERRSRDCDLDCVGETAVSDGAVMTADNRGAVGVPVKRLGRLMGRGAFGGSGVEVRDEARASLATGRAGLSATGETVMPMGAGCAGFSGGDGGVSTATSRGWLAAGSDDAFDWPVGFVRAADTPALALVFSEVGASLLARGGIASKLAPTGSLGAASVE